MKARRPWAWPLVPLYGAALATKDRLRRVGIFPTRRLQRPVISIGSLSAGGAGKTPVVIALAEMLQQHGWQVDVLSRGYGRSGRGVEQVAISDGKQVLRFAQDENFVVEASQRFGDEPVLIAQSLGVPVWVGANRFVAGKIAEEAGKEREADSSAPLRDDNSILPNHKPKGVHLLDDGFQHRQLARTLDVVLVTEQDLHDALLPAGNLREPLAALRRADAIVLRDDEFERVEPKVRMLMREGALLWSVCRTLRFSDRPGESNPPPGSLAFCAIARPEGFSAMLTQAGCKVAGTIAFGDHHRYTTADMERLVAMAREHNAMRFITTEKDAVKLSQSMLEQLRALGPVVVAGLDVSFLDEAEVLRELEARLG